MIHRLTVVSAAILLLALAACGGDRAPREDGVARAEAAPHGAPGEPGPAKAKASPPAARGPEHEVFSLGDNRLLAHVQRGGGVVALAGSPGFAKYVHFARPKLTWQLNQRSDGRRVAIADLNATVDL